MKITKPKKQLFNTSTTYYVSSESGGDKHIVVRFDGTYFCDCKDFMTRKLPLYGSVLFSLCKHGGTVRDSEASKGQEVDRRAKALVPSWPFPKNAYSKESAELAQSGSQRVVLQPEKKQFGIFFYVGGKLVRSEDHPGTFTTAKEAQEVADKRPHVEYTVQEIGASPLKQFAVFAIWDDGSAHRSVDVPGKFPSRLKAYEALDEYHISHPSQISVTKREVREVS